MKAIKWILMMLLGVVIITLGVYVFNIPECIRPYICVLLGMINGFICMACFLTEIS